MGTERVIASESPSEAIWWDRGAAPTAILGTAVHRPSRLPRPDYIGARNDGESAYPVARAPCGGTRAAEKGRGEVGEALEADIYDQAATLGIPAIGGDFLAGIEEFRKQLRLKAAKIRNSGTSLGSSLLSDPDRVSDSPGVRESEQSTPTNLAETVTAATALAIDRGAYGDLCAADFDVATPRSLLGRAWYDAAIALSAVSVPGKAGGYVLVPCEPTEAMLESFHGLNMHRDTKAWVTWVYQQMLAAAQLHSTEGGQ